MSKSARPHDNVPDQNPCLIFDLSSASISVTISTH